MARMPEPQPTSSAPRDRPASEQLPSARRQPSVEPCRPEPKAVAASMRSEISAGRGGRAVVRLLDDEAADAERREPLAVLRQPVPLRQRLDRHLRRRHAGRRGGERQRHFDRSAVDRRARDPFEQASIALRAFSTASSAGDSPSPLAGEGWGEGIEADKSVDGLTTGWPELTAVPSPSHRPATGPSLSREGRGKRSVSNDRDTETQNRARTASRAGAADAGQRSATRSNDPEFTQPARSCG